MILRSGVVVESAHHHHGVARALVHRLKYEGVIDAAVPLAEAMAGSLPADATAVVPVPRAVGRRIRYGVDPAQVLAELVAAHRGIPLVAALRPGLWWARHAVRRPDRRLDPKFGLRLAPPAGAVLVDDVVTSGATIGAAAAVTGLSRALTATGAGRVRLDATRVLSVVERVWQEQPAEASKKANPPRP